MSILETKIENLKQKFPDYVNLAKELDLIKDQSTRNLKLAVVGEFNAGKSTFINAILGDKILPSGISDTTAFATYIHYSRVRCIYVVFKNGESEVLPIEELHKFKHQNKKQQSSFIQIDSAEQIDLEDIIEINVMVNCDFLKGLTLIDTPGFNSSKNSAKNDQITEAVLDDADGVIWLTRADQVSSKSELDKIKKNVYQYKDRSICLISKVDLIDEDDIQDVLHQAKSIFSEHFLYYIPVAAQEELRGESKIGLRYFYKRFDISIKPLMRNWVIKTLEQEVFELIENILAIKQDKKLMLDEINTDILLLYLNLDEIRETILPQVQEVILTFKSNLNHLLKEINGQLRANMDYWTIEEPFEMKKEGFFSDDYFIEYRNVSYYKYSDFGLEKVNKKIYEDFYQYLNQFDQSIVALIEDYHQQINTALDHFGVEKEDELSEIDFTMNIHKNFFFEESNDIKNYEANKNYWEGYFNSGMYCGGVYSLNLKSYLFKYTNKPSFNDLKKELTAFLPLDRLIEMIDEYYVKFEQSSKNNLEVASEFFAYYIPDMANDLDQEIQEFEDAIESLSN